ncbi:MAG: cob(I)yrinic acid a,c-diamide adenosyltransferase [Candidatus Omnitrophota bacterium]|nr:cob(I)yrinic acid a,c-diamide adenosyltransferase [Candidatus Omnitrophota bacterium]
MKRKGLIEVYTGEGKGKTTSAIGLACRARGHGQKVCYISFHKPVYPAKSGELVVMKKIGVDIYSFAEKSLCCSKDINFTEERGECLKGVRFIQKLFKSKKCDVLILDEIIISVRRNFLKEEELLDLLDAKPAEMELVLTGRGCPENVIKKADLISEVKKVKHPYDKGIEKRKGIEY